MTYRNGKDTLPPELLKEIQKYVSGELIYIPKMENAKASWGQLSGARADMHKRNLTIVDRYKEGISVHELTDEYCLSESSIRKIIYANFAT